MTARRLPSFFFWAAVSAAAATVLGSDHVWSKAFGDASEQWVGSVAVDGVGNVVTAGFFSGTVDFGGGALHSAGSWDGFVAKFDAAGNHLWSKTFGDASAQAGISVAVDGSDNVIVTGFFAGTVNFGGLPLTSAGGSDVFLVKFDANGNHLWSRRFGDASSQTGYHVVTDGSGNLVTTGAFFGTVDFGGVPLTSAGQDDIYLAKFNANGTHLWSRRFGGASSQYGRGVAISSSGQVTITGGFYGTVDFGGGALTSAGTADAFLARYDSDGNHLWSKAFGDASVQEGLDVAVDASGDVVVTGDFEGSVDFGGGALTSAGAADIFLAKYSSAGVHTWSKAFGGTATDGGTALAADGPGNVVLTGNFEGTVDFGGAPLVGLGDAEIFLARYAPNGQHLSSARFGDAAAQYGAGVALDGLGNVLLTGQFEGTVGFGGGPLTSSGGYDIFLAKFADLIFVDGFEI